jgi:hypothetical protein
MYSESFWLNMGNVVTLHRSRVNGFKLFSWSHMTTLELWIMVILKWEDYKSKVWVSNKAMTILALKLIMWGTQKIAFKTFKWE